MQSGLCMGQEQTQDSGLHASVHGTFTRISITVSCAGMEGIKAEPFMQGLKY